MLDEVVQAGERPFGGFEEDLSGLALEGLVVVATLGRRQILPRLPRCEAGQRGHARGVRRGARVLQGRERDEGAVGADDQVLVVEVGVVVVVGGDDPVILAADSEGGGRRLEPEEHRECAGRRRLGRKGVRDLRERTPRQQGVERDAGAGVGDHGGRTHLELPVGLRTVAADADGTVAFDEDLVDAVAGQALPAAVLDDATEGVHEGFAAADREPGTPKVVVDHDGVHGERGALGLDAVVHPLALEQPDQPRVLEAGVHVLIKRHQPQLSGLGGAREDGGRDHARHCPAGRLHVEPGGDFVAVIE